MEWILVVVFVTGNGNLSSVTIDAPTKAACENIATAIRTPDGPKWSNRLGEVAGSKTWYANIDGVSTLCVERKG